MKEREIASRDNPALKRARAVRDGKIDERIFVEGVRLAEEALDSGIEIESVIYAPDILNSDRGNLLLSKLSSIVRTVYRVSGSLINQLSDTQNAQGIILVANRPHFDLEFDTGIKKPTFVLIAHRLNNPQNGGAILRTAAAGGVELLITTSGSADVFSPKSLRASMGAAFRVPVAEKISLEVAVEWCKAQGMKLIATTTEQAKDYTCADWKRPVALLLGSEADGLSAAEIPIGADTVTIPMASGVESLNLAAAAAILIYECVRQRRS